jgi:hypothetical protein
VAKPGGAADADILVVLASDALQTPCTAGTHEVEADKREEGTRLASSPIAEESKTGHKDTRPYVLKATGLI